MITWTCKPFADLSVHELYAILSLRNEVFVVEQDCPYQDCDFKDDRAHHFMGTEAGKLLAYTRLLPPGFPYADASIGRVVTSPAARKRGLGRELMEKSIAEITALHKVSVIRIGAQLYLKDFYGSLGFVQAGDVYLEDNIPHIEMLRG